MIKVDIEQGSRLWIEARLGIPTASEFKRIITPTGRLSKSRDLYLAEKLAEYFLGEPVKEFMGNDFTERGHMLEPDARTYYEFTRDVEVTKTGIVYKDESRMVGYSPDGIVGDDGLLELKCPMPPNHFLWLSRGTVPNEYYMQCQGALWVTGRQWLDFVSYYPDQPTLITRVMPDVMLQEALEDHIGMFVSDLLKERERLEELGVTPVEKIAA